MVSCRDKDCSETFEDDRHMEVHFSKEHDDSAKEKSICLECGELIEYYPSSKSGKYCSECQKERPWDSPNKEFNPDIPDEYTEKAYDIENPTREFNLSTEKRGDVSEQTASNEFLKRDVSVLEPKTDNEPYDLVLEHDKNFIRVQIKTGIINNGRITFSHQSTHTNAQGTVHRSYNEDIDIFAVVVPELEKVFLLHIDEVGSGGIYLRTNVPKKKGKYNWALMLSMEKLLGMHGIRRIEL